MKYLALALALLTVNAHARDPGYQWLDLGYTYHEADSGGLEIETQQVDLDLAIDFGDGNTSTPEDFYLRLAVARSTADVELNGVDLGDLDGTTYAMLVGGRITFAQSTDWFFEVGGMRLDIEDFSDETYAFNTGIRSARGPFDLKLQVGLRGETDLTDDTIITSVEAEYFFLEQLAVGAGVAYDNGLDDQVYRVHMSYHY
ncbi:MAG: hypothetical protein GKR90_08025 [Pseudomonadales bacterium]|nr:hypothetical protein [Pseudomonadales bacterium]